MPFAKTDAMLFPGYSGGPAYADGEVVGIVHDGQPVAEVNDPRVMGKGRILLLSEVRSRLPASLVREIEAQPTKSSLGWKDILTPYYFAARANHGLLVYRGANVDLTDLAMQSNYTLGVDRAGSITYEEVAPIADWVANLNPDDYAATLNKTSRDTEAVVAGYSGSFFGVPFSLSAGYTTTPRPGDAIPKTLSTAYSIDETNDTHALFAATIKNYSTGRIKATPGYRIVKYDLQVLSATRVSNEQVLLASDGSSIEFKYTLRSEMLGDGRRGWLKARLVFAERKL
jgi:hypothetical protein